MSAASRPKKSTNVRIDLWRQRALRWGLAVLDNLSADLAAVLAERMFLSPNARPRPEWEAALLDSAQRGSVEYKQARLPTYSWGESPERVLLLHGWEGRGSQLGAFVPKLLASGYQVIAADLPGHGDAAPALTSVVDFGHAVANVIERLGPFAGVIGHSMGAAAIALAHTFRPFQASLVLIGPPRSPRSFFDSFTRHLALSREATLALEARIERRFGMGIDAVDVSLIGQRIPLATLVIHDRGDNMVPFEHGLTLASALPAASLMPTEGLGHRRILRDERVIDAAVSFIQHAQPRSETAPAAA